MKDIESCNECAKLGSLGCKCIKKCEYVRDEVFEKNGSNDMDS